MSGRVSYHVVTGMKVVTVVMSFEIWRCTEVSQNGACGTSVFPIAIVQSRNRIIGGADVMLYNGLDG